VIIGPFLFDEPARPGPFFDGPHTGRAGPFATPSASVVVIKLSSWDVKIN